MNLQDKMHNLRVKRGEYLRWKIPKLPLSNMILAIEGIIILNIIMFILIINVILYFTAPHSIGIDAFLQ